MWAFQHVNKLTQQSVSQFLFQSPNYSSPRPNCNLSIRHERNAHVNRPSAFQLWATCSASWQWEFLSRKRRFSSASDWRVRKERTQLEEVKPEGYERMESKAKGETKPQQSKKSADETCSLVSRVSPLLSIIALLSCIAVAVRVEIAQSGNVENFRLLGKQLDGLQEQKLDKGRWETCTTWVCLPMLRSTDESVPLLYHYIILLLLNWINCN